MSIHPSLSSASKDKAHRNVLKRTERIKQLIEKGKWSDTSKPFGLPKLKIVRLKVAKKEKAAETAEATAAPAAGGATQAKPQAKPDAKADKKAPAEKGK